MFDIWLDSTISLPPFQFCFFFFPSFPWGLFFLFFLSFCFFLCLLPDHLSPCLGLSPLRRSYISKYGRLNWDLINLLPKLIYSCFVCLSFPWFLYGSNADYLGFYLNSGFLIRPSKGASTLNSANGHRKGQKTKNNTFLLHNVGHCFHYTNLLLFFFFALFYETLIT